MFKGISATNLWPNRKLNPSHQSISHNAKPLLTRISWSHTSRNPILSKQGNFLVSIYSLKKKEWEHKEKCDLRLGAVLPHRVLKNNAANEEPTVSSILWSARRSASDNACRITRPLCGAINKDREEQGAYPDLHQAEFC